MVAYINRLDYKAINNAVGNYKAEHGEYPTTEQLADLLNSDSIYGIFSWSMDAIGYDGKGRVWAITCGYSADKEYDDEVQVIAANHGRNVYGDEDWQIDERPGDVIYKDGDWKANGDGTEIPAVLY
jgi:hypothetical protein